MLQERIEDIAEAIAAHPTMTEVHVLSNRDIEVPMICNAVIRNPNIQSLFLRECEIESHMLLCILRDMPRLKSIELMVTRFVDPQTRASPLLLERGSVLEAFSVADTSENAYTCRTRIVAIATNKR